MNFTTAAGLARAVSLATLGREPEAPASPEELQALEERLGFALPELVRGVLSLSDGLPVRGHVNLMRVGGGAPDESESAGIADVWAFYREQHAAIGDLRGIGPHEEARAAHRAEGHAALELGVVLDAGAAIGARPAPVEDIFAVAVAFDIGRSDRGDAPVRAFDDEVLRQPALVGRSRAALFEGVEEGVADEGILVAGAGVPRGGVDLVDARDDADGYPLGLGTCLGGRHGSARI